VRDSYGQHATQAGTEASAWQWRLELEAEHGAPDKNRSERNTAASWSPARTGDQQSDALNRRPGPRARELTKRSAHADWQMESREKLEDRTRSPNTGCKIEAHSLAGVDLHKETKNGYNIDQCDDCCAQKSANQPLKNWEENTSRHKWGHPELTWTERKLRTARDAKIFFH
jgi:hypothetical protein